MFESITSPPRPNWKLRITSAIVMFVLALGAVSLWRMTQMPLKSFRGTLHPLSSAQSDIANRLREHVIYLSTNIGERNAQRRGSLKLSASYVRSNLEACGYTVTEHTYSSGGNPISNLEAELAGTAATDGILVVGAHYDTAPGTSGADDNASGVAAALELARILKGSKLRRTIRFVLFANEEPPYFQTQQMGSWIYARQLHRDRVPVHAMLSLEMLGFYSNAPGSQKYPPLLNVLYPSKGDFIGFVGNTDSRGLVRRTITRFRESGQFPSEGIAAPATWPGIGWSDQWAFWQEGYPAIMITDTAIFRNPHYHTSGDTIGSIDFEKMARVVDGISSVVATLAEER